MLPPPITTAVWTPAFTTSPISPAMRSRVGGWIPYFPSPIRASPESLRRMRRYRREEGAVTFSPASTPRLAGPATKRCRPASGDVSAVTEGLGDLGGEVFLLLLDALAHLVAGEAADGDVLADLGHGGGHDLVDLLLVVLHEGLIDQADRLVELLDLAGEDLLDHRVRLLLLPELDPLDLLLLLEDVAGDLLAADVLGVERGDVERQVADQGLEVLVPGNEVGFAVDLDEDAHLAVVDVG